MSNSLVSADRSNAVKAVGTDVANDFVTMMVADQLFGIPVLTVQDVLGPQRVTRVPLSPPEVAGALNLRGRLMLVGGTLVLGALFANELLGFHQRNATP